MAILIVAGDPGNGKGLYAMDLLEQYVLAGRPVYTNIELMPTCPYYDQVARIDDAAGNWPVYRGTPAQNGKKASSDYAAFWHYCLPGSVIIIDEFDAYIDATEWSLAGKDQRLFHKQHRKLGFDLIYICQSVARIVSYIRAMAQRFVLCEWNWRSMRMFQRMAPYVGVERARNMSRFLRSEFSSDQFRENTRISDVAIPYQVMAKKYFQPGKLWYSTEQLIGDVQHLKWMQPEMGLEYGVAGNAAKAAITTTGLGGGRGHAPDAGEAGPVQIGEEMGDWLGAPPGHGQGL